MYRLKATTTLGNVSFEVGRNPINRANNLVCFKDYALDNSKRKTPSKRHGG